MSSFLCRNIIKSANKVFPSSPLSKALNRSGSLLPGRSRNGLESLVICRSIGWYSQKSGTGSGPCGPTHAQKGPIKTIQLSKTCAWNTCCSVHTENDASLLKYLSQHIGEEKARQVAVGDRVGDFDVETKGSDVKLTKQIDDEMITISFNVNHSVDTDSDVAADDEKDVALVSLPSFVVDIARNDMVLSISCSFTHDYPEDPSSREQPKYADMMTIDEVGVHRGEWSEQVYSATPSTMEDDFYDKFLFMLEDRGIDEPFIEEFINFSTNYENGQYIGFLENLKKFIKK